MLLLLQLLPRHRPQDPSSQQQEAHLFEHTPQQFHEAHPVKKNQ
jgi:hypothetical protein